MESRSEKKPKVSNLFRGVLAFSIFLCLMLSLHHAHQVFWSPANPELKPPQSQTLWTSQNLLVGKKFDINQAQIHDWQIFPGIGPALAGRIVNYRQRHGPFRSVDELRNVSGIGPKKLQVIRRLRGIN